jgi:hypothetical protein
MTSSPNNVVHPVEAHILSSGAERAQIAIDQAKKYGVPLYFGLLEEDALVAYKKVRGATHMAFSRASAKRYAERRYAAYLLS